MDQTVILVMKRLAIAAQSFIPAPFALCSDVPVPAIYPLISTFSLHFTSFIVPKKEERKTGTREEKGIW